MEDSILPPSLPTFFSNDSTSVSNASLPHGIREISSGVKELSIKTDTNLSNSTAVGFEFLEVGEKGKESPVSPTSNKLKRAAAIRVNKISSNGPRRGPIDKQEQRKERSKLLRRSLSLNDTETILEQVSMPSKHKQEIHHTEEMKYRRRQLRRSKSFNEELNSIMPLVQSTQYEEDHPDILNDQTSYEYSPIEAPQDLQESTFSKDNDKLDVNLEIQPSKRPLARRSRSFNVVSSNTNRNTELLRTYSSHSRCGKVSNTVYSEGPLGFYSQKFNATQEPPRDRISGIMTSWKTDDDSESTLSSRVFSDNKDSSTSNQSLDFLSSLSRKLSTGAIKIHKPKVSRLVIQNPSESRALFQPTIPEQLVSDCSLRNDEYQGLFPPSKEIKASRVQFNTRSSLEMRLTKEKLCSVIVEDITAGKSGSNIEVTGALPEIVLPKANTEAVERAVALQEEKDSHQVAEPPILSGPSLSPFLTASRKDHSQVTDEEVHSPSDIGSSFFLTALTDRLKLPFSIEELDLSVSPDRISHSLSNASSHEEEQSSSDSPILQPCSIPISSSESFENEEVSKYTPTTPDDDIPVDTSIKIIREDNGSCDSDPSISCSTQSKIEAIPNIRTSIPYIKRFSMVESAGVVKGILPHLKKKKPSVLGPSNSLRRKSRRIAPQLLHIDTNVSRSAAQHQQPTFTETLSSDESITSCYVNSFQEPNRSQSTHEETISTSSTSTNEDIFIGKFEYKHDGKHVTEETNSGIVEPTVVTPHSHDHETKQCLSLEIQPIDQMNINSEQVTKLKEVVNFTKKVVNATKSIKPVSRSTNKVNENAIDSPVENSLNHKVTTVVSQPVSEKKSRSLNKTKEVDRVTSNGTRSVIYQGFALQIINSNAVKNRYLILMNDMLVIAKPISRERSPSYTLNSRFMVKHIIDLSSISFSVSREKERHGRKVVEDGKAASSSRNHRNELHPLIASTIRRFNMNPYEGIMYMIDKGALRADPLSIATFLHKTPELSRKQIGKFLGMPSNHAILNSFLDRFKFAGLRIDDALRIFLASFRLPSEGNVIDYLVGAFARRWHRANAHYVTYDAETSIKLAFFMMALNADLHNRKAPTKAKMELADFLKRFRAIDATSNLCESDLIEIYHSIRQDKLETAMDDRDHQPIPIETRFPLDYHLVIDDNSARLTLTIPVADRDLRIKPVGDGLVCDIPVLDFAHTNSLTFTVKATSLGRKCLTFVKLGARSRRYSSIPAWSLVVEPPFMQHTFQIGFPGETDGQLRKKFMFGVGSAAERTVWLEKITTTFANTFNHANSELEMIIRRLKNHLISEDSTRPIILTGHEIVQCLQAPITSTTLPELRTSVNLKNPIKVSSKVSSPLHSTSNKPRSDPSIPQSNYSRIRNMPLSSSQQMYNKGPRKTQHIATSNPSNHRLNNQINPNSIMTTGGAKFRIRAG